MSEKPINKFNKAQEDRRKNFVVENDYVADDVVSLPTEKNDVEVSDGGLKSIIKNKRNVKASISITIDANTDEFYMRLGRLVEVSKSKLMGEVLAYSINTNPDIQEMAQSDKKIKKILDDFNDGFY